MTETITKSKRISSKDLGLVQFPGMNPKYWELKKAQQAKWAKEDSEKKNNE